MRRRLGIVLAVSVLLGGVLASLSGVVTTPTSVADAAMSPVPVFGALAAVVGQYIWHRDILRDWPRKWRWGATTAASVVFFFVWYVGWGIALTSR